MRRVVSENSLAMPTVAVNGKLSAQHTALPEHNASTPNLMMTVQRTVANARSAAETHAAAVLASSAMLRAAMVPPGSPDTVRTWLLCLPSHFVAIVIILYYSSRQPRTISEIVRYREVYSHLAENGCGWRTE